MRALPQLVCKVQFRGSQRLLQLKQDFDLVYEAGKQSGGGSSDDVIVELSGFEERADPVVSDTDNLDDTIGTYTVITEE